jgi:hypothetical protein
MRGCSNFRPVTLRRSSKWLDGRHGCDNDRRRANDGRTKKQLGRGDDGAARKEATIREKGSLRKEEAAIAESMVDKWSGLRGKTAAHEPTAAGMSPGEGIRGAGESHSAKEQDNRGSNLHEQPPFCWRSQNSTIKPLRRIRLSITAYGSTPDFLCPAEYCRRSRDRQASAGSL